MRVTYKNPGVKHSIDSILLFQNAEHTSFWSDSLFYFYPEISKEEFHRRDLDGQAQYITDILTGVYERSLPELREKTVKYNELFIKYETQINDALSDAFDIDTRNIFRDLTGFVCLNPVCPRFLKERCFDVFYKNSENGAIGMSIHEMIHFVWFYVWNQLFNDSYDEYETPSLKWILSEMVVESIMSDKRLSSINPYYPRERGGCVYSYFLDMSVDESLVLDTIHEIYKENSIAGFMRASYEFCQKHEKEIRRHIARAEAGS